MEQVTKPQKPLSEFPAVLFDLDGVITDTARFHYMGWKRLADDLGVPFTEVQNESLKGVDRMASLDYILKLGGLSDKTPAQKKALADQKNAYYQTLIKDISAADLLHGAMDLIEQLRSRDIRLAIASASQNAPAIIRGLGIDAYFDHVADARLARSKPASDIFLFAAYGVGIHPSECAGLEDSLAGLKAINDADMYSVAVGEGVLASHADTYVETLADCDI